MDRNCICQLTIIIRTIQKLSPFPSRVYINASYYKSNSDGLRTPPHPTQKDSEMSDGDSTHHQHTKAEEEEEEENPVHGDILESVLSHVPLVDLLPASHVSKSWNVAVSSSLRNLNPVKPWLVVHAQSRRPPFATTTHAYDPRSHVWVELKQYPVKHQSPLRSSHSTILYTLSTSKFSFSVDPLHLTWHHVDGPKVWRTDPVVAAVGEVVVLAGGTCDFEENPLAVEIFDLQTRSWETCESMPEILKDSASSTWASVAVKSRKMYVVEKRSGKGFAFDTETKRWEGPYDVIKPDDGVFSCAITFVEERMVVVGIMGEEGNVRGVKMWEVKGKLLEEMREMGEMPEACLETLKGEEDEWRGMASVSLESAEEMVYIYNPAEGEELVVCEVVGGVVGRWRSVRNAVVKDRSGAVGERVVVSCSSVSMADLRLALGNDTGRFSVKGMEF